MTFHHTPAHAATQAQSKIFARLGSINQPRCWKPLEIATMAITIGTTSLILAERTQCDDGKPRHRGVASVMVACICETRAGPR